MVLGEGKQVGEVEGHSKNTIKIEGWGTQVLRGFDGRRIGGEIFVDEIGCGLGKKEIDEHGEVQEGEESRDGTKVEGAGKENQDAKGGKDQCENACPVLQQEQADAADNLNGGIN